MNEKEIKSELEIKNLKLQREKIVERIKIVFNSVSKIKEEFCLKIKEGKNKEEILKIVEDYINEDPLKDISIDELSKLDYKDKRIVMGIDVENIRDKLAVCISYMTEIYDINPFNFSLKRLEKYFDATKKLIENL